jgi:hypothetical protein
LAILNEAEVHLLTTVWEFSGRNIASILAVCALGLTAYQAIAMRRHNHLSVRPHLGSFSARTLSPSEGRITISLVNNGLGPAFIDSFSVTLDSQPVNARVPLELEVAINRRLGSRPRNFAVGTLARGAAMLKDEIRELLRLQFPATSQAEFDGANAQLDRMRLVITYHSPYDETFVYDSKVGGEDDC